MTYMKFNSGYGERIRVAVKAKGISISKLAAEIGVARTAVYKWIHEETKPEDENIEALAQLLGADAEYLATGKKTPPTNGGGADWELALAALEALEDFAAARGITLSRETRKHFVDIVIESSEGRTLNRDVVRRLIDGLAAHSG